MLRRAPGFAKGPADSHGPTSCRRLKSNPRPMRPAPRASARSTISCAAGFSRVEPAILHPASIFLDMSGEEIRGRLFLTSDASGRSFASGRSIRSPSAVTISPPTKPGGVVEYSYLGPVFRAQSDGGGERAQTGLESFGRSDAEAADAEIFALAMEAAVAAGGPLAARLGDACLFDSLLEALASARGLARGVCAAASRTERASPAILDRGGPSAIAQPGVLAALESADQHGRPGAGRGSALDRRHRRRSAGARQARSPTGSSNRPRSVRASRWRPKSGRSSKPISRSPAIRTRRRRKSVGSPTRRSSTSEPRSTPSNAGTASSRRAGSTWRRRGSAPPSCGTSIITPASSSRRATRRGRRPDPALGGGRYDSLARRLGAASDIPAVGAAICARSAAGSALMGFDAAPPVEPPFVLAVPSKGRLQEQRGGIFRPRRARMGAGTRRARLSRRARGLHECRGRLRFGLGDRRPARRRRGAFRRHRRGPGAREGRPTRRCELLAPLGFGRANVVVAAPQAWIDVRSMADLEDVASAYRAKRGERMRVATKYVNLTRRFFAEHGVADYRIVESLGATEGAPAAGSAEVIVDIATTGATLAANALEDAGRRPDPEIAGQSRRLAGGALGACRPQIRPRDPRPDRRQRAGAALARSARSASRTPRKGTHERSRRRRRPEFGALAAFGDAVDCAGPRHAPLRA